jgi:acetyl esterase
MVSNRAAVVYVGRMGVMTTTLRAVMGLPPGVLRALSGGRTVRDGQLLDAQSQLFVALANRLDGRDLDELTVSEARAHFAKLTSLAPPRPPLAAVRDRRLGGVPVRVYRPHGAARPAPAVVYFHGGGWVVGGLDSHDALCAELSRQTRAVVVSVDYRLAPEHRFPAAVDDGLAAFRAIVQDAEELGVDPRRVALAGDSAGGNLAAVVSVALAGDEHAPVFQLLNYPVTDLSREAPSYALFESGFFLTARSMRWFKRHYAPEPSMQRDPRASPLLSPSLSGLCPACVVVAGFDPLRDEGIAYADRLRKAGVSVEIFVERSALHGFVSAAPLLAVGRRGLEVGARALAAALGS